MAPCDPAQIERVNVVERYTDIDQIWVRTGKEEVECVQGLRGAIEVSNIRPKMWRGRNDVVPKDAGEQHRQCAVTLGMDAQKNINKKTRGQTID